MSKPLQFKISTGLKNIIGKELITNQFIAVFELVKNSYDAGAKKVDIDFLDFNGDYPSIKITDDGTGMSEDDLKTKWLFVAYSEKKEINQTKDYRNRIQRKATGAKGVGRFSCDRLGSKLQILTKTAECTFTNKLDVNWDNFEDDDKNEFIEINVDYMQSSSSEIENAGTTVIITDLRERWSEKDLLTLKKSLSRLINPDFNETTEDTFEIYLNVPDLDEKDLFGNTSEKITGKVSNDIFEKLDIKTTNILVEISKDGKTITSTLHDRGDFIYTIEEKNPYSHLKAIKVKLYYLSRSAKLTFHNLMGMNVKDYGSIFIYKNNFRIHPYGEPETDFFDIDRRHAQGYNRTLGTRDLLGKITIESSDKYFIETSSRNSGFLETPEYYQLCDFFKDKILTSLEKYVVEVIKWGNVSKEQEEGEEITPQEVPEKILNRIANISSKDDILSVKYNKQLFETITEAQKDSLASNLKKLTKLASKANDDNLRSVVSSVEKKTQELFKEKQQSEKRQNTLAKELDSSKAEKEAETNRNFFLLDSLSIEQEEFSKRMHNVRINTDTIGTEIAILYGEIEDKKATLDDVKEFLKLISYLTERINAAASYSGIANFDVEDEKIEGDISSFITDYCNNVFKNNTKIKIIVDNKAKFHSIKLCPQDIATILENAISNAKSADATEVHINLYNEGDILCIDIIDDGNGLNKKIANVDTIFDFMKSYSDGGTGIGLYHIKQIVNDMDGTISVDLQREYGFALQIRIKI